MTKMNRGFTLIELLVVIVVLGVLAVGIFIAINPLERLAQARDAQRKAAIGQLANALQTYYVTHVASGNPWPNPTNYNFMDILVADGNLKTKIPDVPNTPGCLGGVYSQGVYCYYAADPNAYVMIPLESQKEKSKCASGNPYYMWDSGQGKIGVVCVVPPYWSLGSYTFFP